MRDSGKMTIVLLGLAMAAPAYAQQPASPQEVVVVGDQGDQKMVCKKQKETGTRFQKRSCRTVRQWDAIREQQMRDAREFIDRPTIETRRGG